MESTAKRYRYPEPSITSTSDGDEQSVEDEEGGEDRISSLPDPVLCLILSKLPTKCAIATAVLSTKWRYLFSSIHKPSIEIDDAERPESYHPPVPNTSFINPRFINPSFINFVSHLLNHILPQFSEIEELSLSLYENYGRQRIEQWLSTAPPCNVRFLHLYAARKGNGISSLDVLRPFASLSRLELYSPRCNFVAPQPALLFPNLTWLSLTGFNFVGSDSFDRALAACPSLRRLYLVYCRFPYDQDVVCISIPSLRILSLQRCHKEGVVLMIDTPLLESFSYYDDYLGQSNRVLFSTGFRNLSTATLHVKPSDVLIGIGEAGQLVYTQTVAKLLAACSTVTSLDFSVSNLVLDQEAIFPMISFRNLTNLEVGISDIVGWEILATFLQSSPILRVVTVFQEVILSHMDCYDRFQSCLRDAVPVCLSSHLSEFVFREFRGDEDEVEVVQYFLRTARVLKKMQICFRDALCHAEVLEIKRDILTSPVCSTNCLIDIVMRY